MQVVRLPHLPRIRHHGPRRATQAPRPMDRWHPCVDVTAFEISIVDAPTKGAASAKIVLIEYSDFECPYCGRHAQGAYRDIERQYVDTGKIKYVFRHLPLDQIHPSARKAAEAAECAREQGKLSRSPVCQSEGAFRNRFDESRAGRKAGFAAVPSVYERRKDGSAHHRQSRRSREI